MLIEGRSFPEAVQQLARDNHVDLAPEDPAERRRREHAIALAEVNEKACRFYEGVLADAKRGRVAVDHLKQRGVDGRTAKSFRLGYAPNAWNDLSAALVQGGVAGPLVVEAGLAVPRPKGDGTYDRFRGRLVIPIVQDGRIVSFGGRLLEGESQAKYINGPDTQLYDKGRTLFGLSQAQGDIRKDGIAVLVEGYFDVIGLHQAGVKNAVASCGTALTPGHLTLLKKAGMTELAVVFDGDAAGVRATSRAAELCAAAGIPARVVMLPNGEDPDETVLRLGQDGFKSLVRDGQPALEYLLDTALAKVGRSIEERVRAVEAVRPLVSAAAPGLQRDLYVAKVAEKVGAPEAAVRSALFGAGNKAPAAAPAPSPARAQGERADSEPVRTNDRASRPEGPGASVSPWTFKTALPEWGALVYLVRYPNLAAEFNGAYVQMFEHEQIAAWVRQVLADIAGGAFQSEKFVATIDDPRYREKLLADLAVDGEEKPENGLRARLKKIAAVHRQRRALEGA